MNKERRKIADNVYSVRYRPGASAVVTFGNDANRTVDAVETGNARAYGLRGEHIVRGTDDGVLNRLHKLASDSPNKWQLIQTRADFLHGLGIATGEEAIDGDDIVVKPVLDPMYRAWMKRLKLADYLTSATFQESYANEVFVRLTLTTKQTVAKLEVVD